MRHRTLKFVDILQQLSNKLPQLKGDNCEELRQAIYEVLLGARSRQLKQHVSWKYVPCTTFILSMLSSDTAPLSRPQC